jgi:hypothetical protein
MQALKRAALEPYSFGQPPSEHVPELQPEGHVVGNDFQFEEAGALLLQQLTSP